MVKFDRYLFLRKRSYFYINFTDQPVKDSCFVNQSIQFQALPMTTNNKNKIQFNVDNQHLVSMSFTTITIMFRYLSQLLICSIYTICYLSHLCYFFTIAKQARLQQYSIHKIGHLPQCDMIYLCFLPIFTLYYIILCQLCNVADECVLTCLVLLALYAQ